jgi:Asp-tRNA(Asn)/Glu-tRNA(Gln) amidotransferase A subunit family amidase
MSFGPGRLMVVSAALTLSLTTPSGTQTRNPLTGSSATGGARFGIEETTIAQLHAAYLQGTVTARAVTQSYVDRIGAYDKRGPYLNSIITLNPHALDEADTLDAALKATRTLKGPLHGIPVILKDNIDTVDMPTTSGVALFREFVPGKDAFVVARLRQAGAILLAKASLSELALGTFDTINSVLLGFTRNPYNTAYASGGSSGGTGVAIAANFGAVGVGTDTGSSVRSTASINNLVGIRPTVGLVSRTGVARLISRRDTPGPMARTVEDAARLLDVMAGVDREDARTTEAAPHVPRTYTVSLDRNGLKGARIAVFRQTLTLQDGADPRVVALFEQAISDLRSAGAAIVDDFNVPGFETLPRPPQTAAQMKADLEAYFAYEGPTFPIKTVAELRDAPVAKRVHPLHAGRIAEIAAATLPPDQDPETIQGRKDEQLYRDLLGAAMNAARADALIFPVWTFPQCLTVIVGRRRKAPFRSSAAQRSGPLSPSLWVLSGRTCLWGCRFWVGRGPRRSSSSLRTPTSRPLIIADRHRMRRRWPWGLAGNDRRAAQQAKGADAVLMA